MLRIFSGFFIALFAAAPAAFGDGLRSGEGAPNKQAIFQKEMSRAIEEGDLDRVIWISEFFSDIEANLSILKDEKGQNPLHKAVLEGQKPIIHYLSSVSQAGSREGPQRGLVSQPDKSGSSPLHLALAHDKPPDVIRFLVVEAGADLTAKTANGSTPLHLLISYRSQLEDGGLGLARLFVSEGAPVNELDGAGDTALHKAIKSGREALSLFFISEAEADLSILDARSSSPLHLAISYYEDAGAALRVAEALLARGAPANALDESGNAPLHLALIEGRVFIARLLADHPETNLSLPGKKGLTPLQMAIAHGDGGWGEAQSAGDSIMKKDEPSGGTEGGGGEAPENLDMARVLLEKDISVNDRSEDGSSALHYALLNRRHDLAKELILNKGSDVTLKDKSAERTPLHLACIYGAPLEILEALVLKGASVNRKAEGGYTCMHFAVQEGDIETVKWLDEKGAGLAVPDSGGLTPFDLAEDIDLIVYLGRRLKAEYEALKAAKKAREEKAAAPAAAAAAEPADSQPEGAAREQ